MEDIKPGFNKTFENGDFIVAGNNFGCGSSREYAPIVLKELGVGVVIAVSFARIFFRNAVNVRLPVMECSEANDLKKRDVLHINLASGLIEVNRTNIIKGTLLPQFMLNIIKEGGLVPYKRLRHQM